MKEQVEEKLAMFQKKKSSGIGSPAKLKKGQTKLGNIFTEKEDLQKFMEAGLHVKLTQEKSKGKDQAKAALNQQREEEF